MARTRQRGQSNLLFEQKARYKTTHDYEPFTPGPNQNLLEFISKHTTPYEERTDQYDVPAFDRDLIVDKAAAPKAIYDMHTYWSKKHWAAIREYIRHYLPKKYYPEGTGLVLDCFSGSGMTGVAAMMENRPCVLIDASPAAAFISHCYTHPVDPQELQEAYDQMMTAEYSDELQIKLKEVTGKEIRNLQQELDWLYGTKCNRCGGDATTEYVVYSERFQCPRCGDVVALFDCQEAKVAYSGGSKAKPKTEMKKKLVCPHCLEKYKDPHRDYVISTRSKRFGAVPVKTSYLCNSKCRTKRGYFENKSLALDNYKKLIARRFKEGLPSSPHNLPDQHFTRGFIYYRDGLHIREMDKITDLYTTRNAWALGAVTDAATKMGHLYLPLMIPVTAGSLILSQMCRAAQTQFQAGTYYIPPISKELNVGWTYESKLKKAIEAQAALCNCKVDGSCIVTNESATKLSKFDGNSVDYIFTDPPYSAKGAQYAELNEVWRCWLKFPKDDLDNEIIVNPVRGKSVMDWATSLRNAIDICYNILKPGHWMSICYHDISDYTWRIFQDILLDAGFDIQTVSVLDPIQKSINQLNAEKVVKSDLVLNCRKPRKSDLQTNGNGGEVGQISRRVRNILIGTLTDTGGQTRDKLWDIVLKRLLSRGQMAEHRFDDILSEIAIRAESGRWFLKEEYESLSQSDINNEDAAGSALERFTRLRCAGTPVHFAAQIALSVHHLASDVIDERKVEEYISHALIQDPVEAKKFNLSGRMRGVEFYDCLFFYLTRFLKGRPAGQTPRRNLADFLEEYLVRFKDGDKWLYRPPDQAEAIGLKKARQTGLGRRIRQYVSFLRGEGEYPAEKMPGPKTLVSWLKHCAAFGLAEEGVLLFEKGGLAGRLMQLSEDDRYDAEDYYAQCSRKSAKKTASEDADIEDAEEDEE